MYALATTTFAWLIFLVFVVGYALYVVANLRSSRKEIGSEIELAPNRKPYYDDETLEGPKLERTQLLAVLFLALIALALPIYWLFEPQRQANASEGWDKRFAAQGAALFAPTARRRLQLCRLPWRHARHRRLGPVHRHRSEHRRGARRDVEGARAEHGVLQVRRERGALHPRVRPAVLADVTVGARRRWPDERAADPEPARVPEEHPDPARRLPDASGGHPQLRRRSPARRLPGRDPGRGREERRRRHVRVDRRSPVQPRARLRRPTRAPAATRAAGPTTSPGFRVRAPSAGTSRAARRTSPSPTSRT